MSNHTILFMPQFHEPIREGTKRQTIRRPRKRRINPGDTLSLRGWADKPYRSKQIPILNTQCAAVLPVDLGIRPDGSLWVKLGPNALDDAATEEFARLDGFSSAEAMVAFWRATHGLTEHDGSGLFHDGIDLFEGEVIRWRPAP